MKNKNNRPKQATFSIISKQSVCERAEEVSRKKAASFPENIKGLSPEETRRMLHELREHQIELEIQNEELLRAQMELDAARERYFGLYDLAPVGYCIISEQEKILEANLTAATLLGVGRGELVDKSVSSLVFKEDWGIYCLYRKQLFETGEPQACELRMVKQDGAPFWARLESAMVQVYDCESVCCVVLSDITERKRTEDALQQSMHFVQSSKEKYEQTVSMISDVIWRYEVDAQGQLVSSYISPVAERLLGLPAGTFNNNFEKYFSYVHPDDRIAMREIFFSGKKIVEGEYRLIKPDGTIIWQYSKGSVSAGDNGGTVEIGSTMDITERKLAEKKMQDSLKEKEVLFREIHHRVKNNLQIINSLYNLQAEKIKDEKVKGFFKESQARVKAIALVYEKLCESRDMVNINMEEYVTSLAESIRQLVCAGDSRITVQTSVDPGICMRVDTILNCGLIINELMTNAYKHAFPDGRKGKILVGLYKSPEGDYELTVSDDGVGMPAGFVIGTAQTLGLEMVSSLANQVGSVHYKVKNGTAVRVIIKKI